MTRKDYKIDPCNHCIKRVKKCDGEVRQYAVPNGANYCTSYVRDVKKDERRMREMTEVS